MALQFVDRAKMFLKEGGILCQLLPSKLFLNIRNEDWQTQFFQQWILDRVVQLADYSHILFSSAQAPSMILKASKGIIENNNHNVIYDTPKFKPSCRPHGMVLHWIVKWFANRNCSFNLNAKKRMFFGKACSEEPGGITAS